MNRRGFLGRALLAPIAAPAAAKEALKGTVMSAPVAYGQPVAEETTPLQRLFFKARRKLDIRRSAKQRQIIHMHLDIAEKRSWSPAFKQHVFIQREVNEIDLWDEHSPSFMRKVIRIAGLDT